MVGGCAHSQQASSRFLLDNLETHFGEKWNNYVFLVFKSSGQLQQEGRYAFSGITARNQVPCVFDVLDVTKVTQSHPFIWPLQTL